MKSSASGATSCWAYEIFPYVSMKSQSIRRNDTDLKKVAPHHMADGYIPRMITKVTSKHLYSEVSAKASSPLTHTRSYTSYTEDIVYYRHELCVYVQLAESL